MIAACGRRSASSATRTPASRPCSTRLVGSEVAKAEDKLFATLDPTIRQVKLGDGQTAIVTDTVGFIHKLPHQLVDAFRATLEEVNRADVLLEVVDAADPHLAEHRATVQTVLDELGAGDKPRVVVLNKADLAGAGRARRPTATAPVVGGAVLVSALTGFGLDALRAEIAAVLASMWVDVDVALPVRRRRVAGPGPRARDRGGRVRRAGRAHRRSRRAGAGRRARGGRGALGGGRRRAESTTGSDRAGPACAGHGAAAPTAPRSTGSVAEGGAVVAGAGRSSDDGVLRPRASCSRRDRTGGFTPPGAGDAAGLVTLHPEGDGTLHGNVVDDRSGCDHVVGLPFADGRGDHRRGLDRGRGGARLAVDRSVPAARSSCWTRRARA